MKKELGSIWKVKVPPAYAMSGSSSRWMDVTVKIIDKLKYRDKIPGALIPGSREAVEIVDAPAKSIYSKRIGGWDVLFTNWLFPIKEEERKLYPCGCLSLHLWRYGCKCGGT